MPRRTTLNFGDLETWINNISAAVAEEAVERVVRNLKIQGPFYTGEFENAWDVRLGNTSIPATKKQGDVRSLKQILAEGPSPRQVTPLRAGVDFPNAPKRGNVAYTIDNQMEYRDIAKDLAPGRIKGGGNQTAPQDWYTTYVQGGGLATTLALATNRVSKDPKITNFKGDLNR